jgi:hypothetical protein
MGNKAAAARRRIGWLRWVARILLIAWAAYWVFLTFTAGYGAVSVIYMVLVVAILGLTWRQELIGGVLLIMQVIFAWSTLGEMRFEMSQFYLLMIIPPLLVGVLLILCWFAVRFPPEE